MGAGPGARNDGGRHVSFGAAPRSMTLKTTQLASFAAPAIPIAALGMPLVIYLPPFYAEDLGIGLGIVGVVFMVARIWDVLTDLFMGSLTDAIRTKWGRRRPWIVLSVPILLLSVWRVFLPPDDVGWGYLMFWLVVLYVGWTMLTLSHMAWGAELSDDYHVRSRTQAWRQGGLMLGMVTVLALPAVLEQAFGGGGAMRSAAIGWFVIAWLPLTVALAVIRVGERPVRDTKGTGERAGTLKAYGMALRNPLMRRLLVADLFAGTAPGVISAVYLFFVEHALHMKELTSTFLLIYFVSGLLSVPLWLRLSYRFGKHQTFTGAMIYVAVTLPFIVLIPPESPYVYGVANVVYGLGYGAAPVLLRAIVADITDDDALSSGTQRAGLFYSLMTMTNKLGFALSIGIVYVLLELVGFDPQADVIGDGAVTGLKAIFVIPPIVCFVIAAAAMWGFPLDEDKQRELREKVAAAADEG